MTKRTSDQFMAMNDNDLEYDLENVPVTESCDVIRYVVIHLSAGFLPCIAGHVLWSVVESQASADNVAKASAVADGLYYSM
jgi:hypothetical protein